MLCLGVFHGFSGVGYLSKVKGLLSNVAIKLGVRLWMERCRPWERLAWLRS
jgi:hypothetical protein